MTQQPIEITILTPGFPDGENDSVCMPFLHAIAKAHAKSPHQAKVRVLTFQYPFHKNPYSFYQWEVVPFGGKNNKSVFRIWLWLRILAFLLRSKKPNVVVCLWANEASFVGNLYRAISGVHCITWMIGQDVLPANRYLRLLRIDPARYYAMSPMMAATLCKTLNQKMNFPILPMGVDEDMHALFTRSKNTDIHILGAGSLSKLKQWNLFLEVCAGVKKKQQNLRVLLLGDGPEKETLKQQAASLGLDENVLGGEVSNREVVSAMYHSCILLHTSSTEGQSTVISEALRAGMHVVCFDVGRWDIPGKVHVCKDTDEMTNVVLQLLQSSDTLYLPEQLPTASDTWNQLLTICTS